MSEAGPRRGFRRLAASLLSRPFRQLTRTGLGSVLADRIDQLRPDHWDAVTREATVFLGRDFLGAFQEAGPTNLLQRFGLVYRGAEPVAAFTVQSFEVSAAQLVRSPAELGERDRLELAVKKLTAKALEGWKRRVMVCGSMGTSGPHGVAFAPGTDAAGLWPGVAEALDRLRRADKAHGSTDYILLKDLPPAAKEAAAGLGALGYEAVEIDPKMALELPPAWKSLDDYVAGLAKKYRKSVKDSLSEITAGGCTVRVLDSIESHGARLHAMYRAVAARAAVHLAEFPEGYFPALARALGPERFSTIVIERAGELLGFITVVKDRDVAVGYYVGVDYAANETLPIYHRLLYAVIEQAMRWGLLRVALGSTALEAKARLGCKPEPAFVLVRHRVPVVNWVVRRLLGAVPHAEPPERNPFKDPVPGRA